MASARAQGGVVPTSRTSYIGKGRGRGKLAPPKNDGPQQPGRQQVAAAGEPLTGVGIKSERSFGEPMCPRRYAVRTGNQKKKLCGIKQYLRELESQRRC